MSRSRRWSRSAGRGRGSTRRCAASPSRWQRKKSAEISARDDEVARIVAGDPFALREGRLAGRRERGVAGALTQGTQASRHIAQILGDDVDDALLALQAAAAIEEGGAERGAAEAFEDRRPDDQIGDPGLVLKGDEDDAVGAARALPNEDEPGDREAPVDRQGGEIGGGGEAFARQFGAQEGERVALYREARRRVILDDMLAERHLRQQRRRPAFAPLFVTLAKAGVTI